MQHMTRKTLITVLSLGLFAAGVQTHAATYEDIVLSDAPIGYYQFEEATGASTAIDASASANDAGYNNGVTLEQLSADPRLGNAAGFSGGANVRIPDIAAYNMGTSPASFSFWYNTNSDSRGDLLTYKGGGDFGIHSNSQSDPAGFDGSASVYHNSFRNQGGANNNQWHQLVYVREGTGSGQSKLYIDGQLASTGSNNASFDIANDLLVGSNHDGDPSNPNIGFSGRIDEFAAYDSALTEGAVRSQYFAAVGRQYAINFGSNEQALDAADVAGHQAIEQANWNNASGNTGSLGSLVDDQGNARNASVTWSGSPATFALGGTATNGDQKMMKGYLDTGNDTTTTVTVSDLGQTLDTSSYDVYLYFDGSNGNQWRKGEYTINGVTLDGEDSEDKDFIDDTNAFQLPVPGGAGNQPYVELLNFWDTAGNNDEGNFVVFRNVTGSSFTLTATPGPNAGVGRAPINGLQIVGKAVPTPTALPAGLALLGVTLLRRRR